MEGVYSGTSVNYRTYISPIASEGVQIVDG